MNRKKLLKLKQSNFSPASMFNLLRTSVSALLCKTNPRVLKIISSEHQTAIRQIEHCDGDSWLRKYLQFHFYSLVRCLHRSPGVNQINETINQSCVPVCTQRARAIFFAVRSKQFTDRKKLLFLLRVDWRCINTVHCRSRASRLASLFKGMREREIVESSSWHYLRYEHHFELKKVFLG